jgi:hypothetical protein
MHEAVQTKNGGVRVFRLSWHITIITKGASLKSHLVN